VKGRGGEGKEGDGKEKRSRGEGRERDPTPSRPQSIFLDTPLVSQKKLMLPKLK